jgi:hypothetical protein
MTRVRFGSAAWVAILLLVSACGGRSHPGSTPAVDQNTLTADQLHQRSFYSAYEAVEALRPNWLSHHATFAAVQVYVDDNHMGGVEVLRTMHIPSVAMIRHIDGIQATARYGTGHEAGVILVTTRAAGH